MKKVVLNISDHIYERLRFEALYKEQSVSDVIYFRLLERAFCEDVEKAYDIWVNKEFSKLMED
jgi:predicted CopG family antitoxin